MAGQAPNPNSVSTEFTPLPFRDSDQGLQSTPASPPEEVGPPEVPPEEIIFDKKRDFIGEGAFGKVYRGKCRGKDVAVKMPVRQKLTKEERKAFQYEVGMLKRIFHPNVVLFLGACTDDNNLMMVSELMEKDLEQVIHGKPPVELSIFEKLRIAKDAALGMNWLHGICSIVHRDLKPANILIDKNGNAKVTDFGFCEFKPRDQLIKDKRGPKGTALYMSPEVMNSSPFDEKSDVYSFGLILWELLTREELFAEYEEFEEFQEAICMKDLRPAIPDDTEPSFAWLMQRCWAKDPTKRPSFKEIVFRLDEVIVDYYLKKGEGVTHIEEGRKFWKEHFLMETQALQERVNWKDFVKVLSNELQMNASEFDNTLKPLLAAKIGPKNEEFVTLERFVRILQWFGPFFLSSHAKTILSEINLLLSQPWFHGDISKDLSEKRLNTREKGTFLVRLSTTNAQYPFTISKIGDNHTYLHKRIKHLPDGKGFSVPVRSGGNKVFKSVVELVADDDLGLTTPCPKSVKGSLYEDDYQQ